MMKKIFCAMLVLGSAVSASAQIQTNAGVQYLQAMQKDMSTDFYDLSNTYFLADSLVRPSTSMATGPCGCRCSTSPMLPTSTILT